MLKKLRVWGRGTGVPHAKSTDNLETVTMPLPQKIVLPMQQHIGAPCKPIVKKGDAVYVGSVVGQAGGFVSADIHSGVSGTVAGIEKIFTPLGALVDAVTIEPDGQQTIDALLRPPTVQDRESFVAAVAACGLVGLGGAGFPTAVKLSPPAQNTINTLLINAAECEPFITADNREVLECADSLISGIIAVKKYLDIPKVIIGIERNKPQAMDLLFSLTKGDDSLVVAPLPSHYPQGAEKVLIQSVTGKEVPNGGLPADVGVIVLNVTTVSAIGKYLSGGMPLMSKRLTVDGSAIARPQNVEVIIGTPIEDVIAFCGGYKESPAKVLCGGPMMGIAMQDLSFPIIKQNNAILAFAEEDARLPEEGPCIRCGSCINSCPMMLAPIEIATAFDKKDTEEILKQHAEVCMNCGVCSYVCPAKRRLAPKTSLARALALTAIKEGR